MPAACGSSSTDYLLCGTSLMHRNLPAFEGIRYQPVIYDYADLVYLEPPFITRDWCFLILPTRGLKSLFHTPPEGSLQPSTGGGFLWSGCLAMHRVEAPAYPFLVLIFSGMFTIYFSFFCLNDSNSCHPFDTSEEDFF